MFVMKAIMILLGQKTDWKAIKSYISDVNGFLKELLTFNVEKVKEKVWEKVRKEYINNANFDPVKVKSVNVAAASLCTWANACSRYAEVVKKVAPKKARLAEVTEILNSAQAELSVKQKAVQEVKDQVAKLEADCTRMKDEKEDLENQMETSRLRMGRAEKLVVLLKDEGVRWAQTVEVISDQIEKLVGNVFLSCACISYFGAFTGVFR